MLAAAVDGCVRRSPHSGSIGARSRALRGPTDLGRSSRAPGLRIRNWALVAVRAMRGWTDKLPHIDGRGPRRGRNLRLMRAGLNGEHNQ
jgi:hypothetical protein